MHELLIQTVFYVFAALAIFSALMVVTQNNPVRCVLFLVLTFFASAVLWILVAAEFLALILILVYVGAVMTLFLFVVMMLNIDVESMKSHFVRYLPFGLIIVAFLTGLLLIALPDNMFKAAVEQTPVTTSVVDDFNEYDEVVAQPAKTISNTEAIGRVLYTDYVFAFELAAVLLLVAIIAAITLAHRNIIRSKRQSILSQIMTDRNDRIELIAMKSEKQS
ncbi:NADH-quinone oxidoreductase subunit J [Legionella taurinensis]|uniref:NADH-quinone oxidoreductase subunit J n=1 Tax=Legionella taurinensis TaxID=70611 RepID=A0A3A5LI57_9GAMM|nr:NADH-quinone oxidoreductase subunit J [Legionella taurinensis]MDX1837796.1 NADH-quinone oxidoreductase subunit J [Legionella taurinensis]PUT39700.1 NADH-quinone oxidoreductase subunit J [Legionella taurinensis]PUT43393.1 NADH-quinone oxidoreductase subunit J [Legionella taurinensis]PUT45839.1 NADH-quinone oxidoreductase subunit J [Legionella taurinensis]PUT47751.1 NADH-quinone oxidoreductase subunit J [Legionella taurinensis]